MSKITVTYHAPKGDNKVVETRGLTFYDGQSQEIDADDHKEFLDKARGNQHFEVKGGKPAEKDHVEKVNLSQAISEATSHDFEKDRQDALKPKQRGRPPSKPAATA